MCQSIGKLMRVQLFAVRRIHGCDNRCGKHALLSQVAIAAAPLCLSPKDGSVYDGVNQRGEAR
jgi:hypothetical protein